MRSAPILHVLSLFVRFMLISVVGILIVLIVRQWNEGISMTSLFMPAISMVMHDNAGENMKFIAYSQGKKRSRGKKFSSKLKPYLERWKISDSFHYKFQPVDDSKVTFVTYSSSNHFYEARRGIRSLRSVFKNKIIFYDLGLRSNEITELKNVCNVEVRKFPFDRYPKFVKNLMGYNFKPLIMAEVFSELESFWIIDTSVRFFNITPTLFDFYANITSGILEPIALRHPSSHSIYATTHSSMYKYLPIDLPLAKDLEMLDANTMFITRSEMAREAVKWNALCAVTPECMAPSGSKVNCWFELDRYKTLANCHRYDQSSINIIVASLLERDGWKRRDRKHDDSMSNFTMVMRDDGDEIPLSIPC